VEIETGQWVRLCLIQRPMASLNVSGCRKLGPKFYGLFQIMVWIDSVAYKLK
jgi:hypothetical protein